ncbi:Borealin-lik [Metarhizium album ARSEF 1941]|uniref:Borealin-lik n=1 Tax=Metarhizium album (strain ARSEF 1941) TaxID=1081103 RepID=A0A0B2WPA1_METAS|nr:Borealin-lik [Metarhizium album ARSEF 1941]KHN95292.1 Borealin-lik [Metarhizium album ARSEF 1941]
MWSAFHQVSSLASTLPKFVYFKATGQSRRAAAGATNINFMSNISQPTPKYTALLDDSTALTNKNKIMAPIRNRKRVSEQSTVSREQDAATDTKVPVKSPSTPHERSPLKKRKMGISTLQKQALIDNLQLEVTERARRLRAQYHLQAQGLRSRIEIRINRIPVSLRKLTIGELILKCSQQEQGQVFARPPPVPAKDTFRSSPQRALPARSQAVGRGYKRMSEIAGDKENDAENRDGAKKKIRTETGRVRPNQVLSPTSSNSRLGNMDRSASPAKPQMSRPGSPLKPASSRAAASSVLSSMVEKAKATRTATRTRGTRKVTTTSEASSASTTATKSRRPATTAASRAPISRPATRTGRRPSGTSDTSEGSVGTVVRKPSASKKAAPAAARTTVMGTIRKGVTSATTKRAATRTTAAPTTAASARVLRKRG